MTQPVNISVAVLALCLCSTALAGCNRDEAPTFVPESGYWSYVETMVVSNSCDANLVPDPPSSFLLSYGGGNSFQVEVSEQDVYCDIDGAVFDCGNYTTTGTFGEVDLTWTVTWEAECSSESEAEGTEAGRVTCAGDACVLLDSLPCSVPVTCEAAEI